MVDKQNYINTVEDLLEQNDAYITLADDPTSKRNRLMDHIKSIKAEGAKAVKCLKVCIPKELGTQVLWVTQNSQKTLL